MYLTGLTRIAAAFGFIAFVLVAGGNANAQTACFGVGPGAITRALNAIDAVDVEVEDIDADATSGSFLNFELISIYYSIDNENSCLADERTSLCVSVVIEGIRSLDDCSDSAPTPSGSRFGATIKADRRISGEHNVSARVKVRYYGAGGAYTSWSPKYTTSIEF